MLEKYNPNYFTYKALWEKYSKSTPSEIPKIGSQEQSIQASIRLKQAFEALAKEYKMETAELIRAFINGTQPHFLKNTKSLLLAALSNVVLSINRNKEPYSLQFLPNKENISEAEAIQEHFELYFEFESLEDLFLSEENDEKSVIPDSYGISL